MQPRPDADTLFCCCSQREYVPTWDQRAGGERLLQSSQEALQCLGSDAAQKEIPAELLAVVDEPV